MMLVSRLCRELSSASGADGGEFLSLGLITVTLLLNLLRGSAGFRRRQAAVPA